jgi:protein arginine kinase activator
MNHCQFCGSPATVHLTDIVHKKKREMHLCEGCARKHNLLPSDPGPQLNLHALIQLIVGPQAGPPAEPDDPAALICPSCGLQYAQFRADGRLGCPAEYDTFRAALEPLLERVHRGTAHVGKVPRAVRRTRRAAELDDLRALLADAVAAENYEEAARVRDRIRAREAVE